MIYVDPSPKPPEWNELCRASEAVNKLMEASGKVVVKNKLDWTPEDFEVMKKFDKANEDLSIANKRWKAFRDSQAS